eukprot:g1373.t1
MDHISWSSTLCNAWCQALSALKTMKLVNLPIDQVTRRSVVISLERALCWPHALMLQHGDVTLKAGPWQQAALLLESIVRRRVSAQGLQAPWRHGLQLLSRMSRRALQPRLDAAPGPWPTMLWQVKSASGFADTAGINASITAAGRAVCWEVALGLLLHMEGATMARVHPDHISYSAALAALKQENLWKTSLGFLTRASTRAARVNPGRSSSFGSEMMVLGALAPGGHWRRICDLARTFGLSESAFLSAFLSACNDWRLALVVLPHHPDATEVAAAQSSCGTCRQWRRVLRLLGSLQLSRQNNAISRSPRRSRRKSRSRSPVAKLKSREAAEKAASGEKDKTKAEKVENVESLKSPPAKVIEHGDTGEMETNVAIVRTGMPMNTGDPTYQAEIFVPQELGGPCWLRI